MRDERIDTHANVRLLPRKERDERFCPTRRQVKSGFFTPSHRRAAFAQPASQCWDYILGELCKPGTPPNNGFHHFYWREAQSSLELRQKNSNLKEYLISLIISDFCFFIQDYMKNTVSAKK